MPKYFDTGLTAPMKIPEVKVDGTVKPATSSSSDEKKKKKKREEDDKDYKETASGDVYEDKGYNYNGGYDGSGFSG